MDVLKVEEYSPSTSKSNPYPFILFAHCIIQQKLASKQGVEQSPTLGAHTHGFWVGMGAMLLFMGGHGCDIIVHGWASVLCIPASNSKSE
jgi:hypothetical protein